MQASKRSRLQEKNLILQASMDFASIAFENSGSLEIRLILVQALLDFNAGIACEKALITQKTLDFHAVIKAL